MEEQILQLIEVIKESNSSNNIVLICTIISSFIAIVSLLISLFIFFLQIKDRLLKKKILGFVYSYFAPTYMVDKLPSTEQIENDLKCIIFSKKDIFNTLIELNKENFISAVGDLSTNLPNIKWKPNTIYHNNGKDK